MIGSLHHIGIAVSNLEQALHRYEAAGFHAGPAEVVESEGVRLAFVRSGETLLELLESLRGDGVIATFISKRGEGLHHLAFHTQDIRAAMSELRAHGFNVLDAQPRRGHGGRLVAFVHPKSFHGVLLELVQE